MKKNKLWVYVSVITAMLLWSMSFIWYKEIYQFLKPITLVFLRLIISSVILLSITLITGRLQKIKKIDYKLILLLAFLEPLLYFIGESFGMLYVSPVMGAVIISTIPLFVPIVSHFFYREKLSLLNIFGIMFSTIGVGLVIFDNSFSLSGSMLGITLMFMAVASAVFYSILILKISTKYNTLTIVTYQNTIGVFYFIPLFFIFEYEHFKTVEFSSEVLIPLFEMAVFASSIAYLLYIYGMRNIGISKTNIFVNLIPVFTAIFSFWLFKEDMHPQKIIGILVVIGGLFLSQIKKKLK